MKVTIDSYSKDLITSHAGNDNADPAKVQLVLGFGAKALLSSGGVYNGLQRKYPGAAIVLASTSGEIFNTSVLDDTLSVTAIEFEKTTIRSASVDIKTYQNSFEAGQALVKNFALSEDLCLIMILSDGGKVNGSELVNGINQIIQHKVPVTGGLAGDGADFISTVVGINEDPKPGKIVAIAFYSHHLKVAHGSMGGWEMFGPEKTVTQSAGNQLFEIDHEKALSLYKKYLGPYAEELPRSALLFPLSVRLSPGSEPVVRTILSIDAVSESMVFAGDVPQGSRVRFMKANFDKLIEAASDAARQTSRNPFPVSPRLAILISCVGRKLILDSRIEEEVEAVRAVFKDKTLVTGFYSYGEISPFTESGECQLHNQTMTITTLDEQ